MHEIKLTENIVSLLEKEVQSSDIGEVRKIHLEVGKLRYIAPDIMISCFEHVPKSRKLKDAKIDIKVIPVKIKCMKCGIERTVDDGIYECLICSSGETEIISGNEFILKGIEW